jgi:molybdopterin/thiamine biosynthesis adenylyltransferase
MTDANDYRTLVSRNWGYVDPKTQERISETRVLIAGCGMGSALAVCAARTGFRKFVLADGDVVETHNLNRQFYGRSDIGVSKVEALAAQIKAVNPYAEITVRNENLDSRNTPEIVAACDIVFDTVDFVDMAALTGLHDEARRQGKPLFTAVNVGFGALVWYFPPDAECTFPGVLERHREKIEAEGRGPVTYADIYISFVDSISGDLDEEVVAAVRHTLSEMRDGRACPAPQLAVGSFSVAALAVTMMHDLVAGRPIVSSPDFVIQSYRSLSTRIVRAP